MIQETKQPQPSIRFVWMAILLPTMIVATGLFTLLLAYNRSQDYIETTDARLLTAAEMLREIDGSNYHDQINGPTSISKEQFDSIVKRNDDLCRRLHLQYLWSVLQINDQLVFTSATHSNIDDPSSPVGSFFEVHRDPKSFSPALGSEMKPTFSTFNNEWGMGRQVLIPSKDSHGRTYILGASLQMVEYDAMIRQTILVSVAIGLGIMVCSLLLTLMLTRRLTEPIIQLTSAADQMSSGDLEIVLPSAWTRELQSLSRSLDKMRQGLKQQIKSLRESRDLLNASQQISKIGGWEWDVKEQSMFWTDEVYRIHGLSPADTQTGSTDHIQKSILCYDLADRPIIQAAFQDCIEKGKPYDLDLPFTTMQGERRWIRTKAEAVTQNGEVVLVVGNMMDITERKMAEDALRMSEQKYRLLVENANDIVYSLTPDGTFIYVSPTWTRFLGHAISEVENHPFQSFIYPEDLPACLEFLDKTIKTGEKQSGIEYRARHKDGTWHWHTSNAATIKNEDGIVVSYIGIARDISERKKAEESILASQVELHRLLEETKRSRQALLSVVEDQKRAEAEKEMIQNQLLQSQKMESVGRLAGGMAHDFNNLLGVIMGHAETALATIAPDQSGYQDLLEILTASERSADLIRQLLTFSRKQIISPRILNINDSISNLLKMLKRLIGEDIELVWQPGSDLKPVLIDPSQLDQVLINLMVNARDAIPGVGKIAIKTGSVLVDERDVSQFKGMDSGQYLLLTVSDNGCGMDDATLSHLFEPFFTTKEVGKGTGLGLATIFGIIKQNNGNIYVSSKPGEGTTFNIYLPVCDAEVVPDHPHQEEVAPRRGSEKILMVEDEEALLQLGVDALEDSGYTVLAANTPEEALRLMQEHSVSVDLIITDVVMPKMNGKELVKQIRLLHPGIKCLFMSGYTADIIADQGVLDKDIFFIQKPFSLNSLTVMARQVLENDLEG